MGENELVASSDLSTMDLDAAAAWYEQNVASQGLNAKKQYAMYLLAKEQETKAFEVIGEYVSQVLEDRISLHGDKLVETAEALFYFGSEALSYVENELADKCFDTAALLYGMVHRETKDDDALLLQYRQDIARQMIGENAGDILKWSSIENGISSLALKDDHMGSVSRAYAMSLVAQTYAVRAKVHQAALMNSSALDLYLSAMELAKQAGEILRSDTGYKGLIDIKGTCLEVYLMLSDGYSSLGNLFLDIDVNSANDALESALKAIDIARNEFNATEDRILLFECNTYSRIAMCCMHKGNNEEAAKFIEKAIDLQKKACTMYDLEFVYTELCLSYYSACSIYRALKRHDKAMEYGQLGLEAYDKAVEAGENVPEEEIYEDLKKYALGKKKGFFSKLFG